MEYALEYLKEAAEQYAEVWQINEAMFVHGRGHRKTTQQRHCQKLKGYAAKLEEYVEKSKSVEKIATATQKQIIRPLLCESRQTTWEMTSCFQLIMYRSVLQMNTFAVIDVNQYRSDMDCFIPLMNKFYTTYGFYPKYPVADAGYGSYNNYIFCEQQGMEKYKEVSHVQERDYGQEVS